jgi:GxxExxY protein
MNNMNNMKKDPPSRDVTADELTEKVIGCAIKLHRVLGPGFLENIYHQALAYELGKAGIPYVNEARMQVKYEGIILGDYIADFLIEKRVVVEIKAVETVLKAHEIQLVNYLSAIRFDIGLIINFGSQKVQVKRKFREFTRPAGEIFSRVLHVPPV